MTNTHDKPLDDHAVEPAEDCELPEPVRTEHFQTADCVHGTKFLLVTQYDGTCVWQDAEKYWARSQGRFQRENYTYERTDHPSRQKNVVIDVDWNEKL